MDEDRLVERRDPEEVFSILSNGTRVAILRALWERGGDPASFSELRDAVGMRDSGQFNYHLDSLVGVFVRKTPGGYELTEAGQQINGAIEAGSFTMGLDLDPIELDDPCPTCGGDRTLRYEDETVRVECDSCPVGSVFGVPPSAFADRDREAIPRIASRYLRSTFQRLDRGFCSFCDGRVESTIRPLRSMTSADDEAHDDLPDRIADRLDEIPLVRYDCERCGATPKGGLALALLDHPDVVRFYQDHGVDARELSIWDFAGVTPDQERIRSRDPLRASVTFRADGDSLTLVVDDELRVVETESGNDPG